MKVAVTYENGEVFRIRYFKDSSIIKTSVNVVIIRKKLHIPEVGVRKGIPCKEQR